MDNSLLVFLTYNILPLQRANIEVSFTSIEFLLVSKILIDNDISLF